MYPVHKYTTFCAVLPSVQSQHLAKSSQRTKLDFNWESKGNEEVIGARTRFAPETWQK